MFAAVAVATAALLPVAARAEPAVPAPTASQFAQHFVTLANAFAMWQGYRARVVHPDCVEPSLGHYMCAYATREPGLPDQCRLMQAQWLPRSLSLIRVTLAGRVPVCGSLRAALDSLDQPPAT